MSSKPHGRIALIMAGGRGQRFWPVSTRTRPKQFLDLERCGRTLLQATYDRILPLVGSPSRVLVATAREYVPLVQEQLPRLPLDNLLVEPEPRDSAPAIALASLVIQSRFGNPLIGVFASDHRIGNVDLFRTVMNRAYDLAAHMEGLVTVGIRPTRAATGYGYIEKGAPVEGGYRVARFVEKPARSRAEAYVEGGRHFWNAGMFAWSTTAILEELDAHAPEVMSPLREAFVHDATDDVFGHVPKISIDYAVMEATHRAYLVPGEFDWDDIGDWVALERLLPKEHGGANTVVGRHVGHDVAGNIIYTDAPEDVIVTLGVEDLVIVKNGDTVLVIRKDRVQEVKTLLADDRLADVLTQG